MFYLTTHSTYFIYGYMDKSDSEIEIPLPPHGLLFPISSKGSFIFIIPQTGYYGLCYTCRGILAGTRNSSVYPQWVKLVQYDKEYMD